MAELSALCGPPSSSRIAGLRVHEETMLEAESDEALMLAVQDGNVQAYRLIVRRYLKRIYAVARRILPHDADAEDVVQDTFLRVWSHRHNWSPGAARFTTWLHRIAINRCIDYRRRPLEDRLDDAAEPVDERPQTDQSIHDRQLHAALAKARRRLPTSQQIALALYYNEGMTGVEVAAVMGLSQSAAEALLKRARQQLRVVFARSAIRAQDAFDDR
ncbi:sigma-70 family RNA polymerase sigma factor [Oleisolibacter albus]|uniref:sigma-70 family RNA polymerase sigma factor n=1 Tax=Oleisolibacter albus TaxID=2171757 RepID=UPI0013900A71|nr:sigma-70 family RNA polymerase sigma factor [Oleisolibacter albus]